MCNVYMCARAYILAFLLGWMLELSVLAHLSVAGICVCLCALQT